MPCENETYGGTVKRFALAFAALLVLSVPVFAAERDSDSNNIVDEVIKMWKSNVAEETIIQYVSKSEARFSVTADDVIDMADAKVPRTVIKAVLDEADARGDRSRGKDYRDPRGMRPYYPSYYGPGYSGWYGASLYDPWYYDPFWYGPRISVGFRVGGGHVFRGRHSRHR